MKSSCITNDFSCNFQGGKIFAIEKEMNDALASLKKKKSISL